jgi:hypothetical protein
MEAMTAQCAKHHFDRAVGLCGHCGLTFCAACLVYAHGPDKPPYCIPCALTAGGVRRASTAPKASWREKRARRKLLAAQAARLDEVAALGGSRAPRPAADATTPAEPGPIRAQVDHERSPLEEPIDWSAPFESSFAD